MYFSEGSLRYSDTPLKLVVEVDSEIVRYYRSFIPKCYSINKPKYGAHISVVRKEIPPNMDKWGKYEGKTIQFEYENIINFAEPYFWIDAYCQFLVDLRIELGLIGIKFNSKAFHITLANIKNLE